MPFPRPRVARRRLLTAAGLPLALASLVGCTGGSDQEEAATPTPDPRSAHLDLSGLPVPRAPFCEVLPAQGVTDALQGEVAQTGHYDNGDEVEVRPGYTDIVHEYGCVYESADGHVARAWVFGRPVDRSEARSQVRRARRGRDCVLPDSIAFGTPSLVSVCEVPASRTDDANGEVLLRARLEGLFGDSYVGCEVAEPLAGDAAGEGGTGGATRQERRAVVQRAEQWCTEVVTAVGAAE
jgi:hypothetical protein